MFNCKVFTKHDCWERCCFICPDLAICPNECGLSGIDDKCLYKEDENPEGFYSEELENEIPLCGELAYATI